MDVKRKKIEFPLLFQVNLFFVCHLYQANINWGNRQVIFVK